MVHRGLSTVELMGNGSSFDDVAGVCGGVGLVVVLAGAGSGGES